MDIKTNWKRNLILIITMLAVLLSMLNPALTAFADLDEANQEFNEQSAEFLEDADDAKDIIRILEEDAAANPNPDRNTINFVMKRLLYPGVYVNDVRDGIVSSSIGVDKDDILIDDKYACNPDAPNNLINHNCNIPNFTTGLIQNIADPFMSPFSNAGKSSSYSVFGLGVPNNIPGGTVPINPENRTHTYTALELFGYNLQLTSYKGEWDQIVVSNSSRMLSNFGVIDRITLVGTSLWNGVKEGVGAFIENFSFNPLRWFGNIGKSFEAGASAGINTVVDTSELNVVATNAWKRPRLDSSLYNIYVMSDAEVIRETSLNYFNIFSSELNQRAGENAELNEVLSMNPNNAFEEVTNFSYDPTWETDESIAAREAAEEERESEQAHNANERYLETLYAEYTDETYTPDIISPLTTIPDPVYYTENEQLGFWEEDPAVAGILSTADSNGLISGSASNYDTYEEMMEEWEDEYTPYFERNFDALGETVTEILDDNDASVFMEYPWLDPKQGISRYACANADGTMQRKEDGTAKYVYEHNNDGSTEFLASGCSPARTPIGGGLMGNGWDSSVIDDTRHISNVSDGFFGTHQITNGLVSFVRSINSFVAKITNVILDLSFSPILERLGIDVIIAELVEGFRDTVFFPLASLVAAIGALMLFFQVLKNGSAWQLLGSLGITLFIFVAGAAFLLHPSATIKLVDEVPSKIDSIIANAILVEDDGSSYCSTGGGDADGIRTAQCNVWGAMVFEPWVHLQFGTGSDNLYAKGNGPSGSGEMENNNQALVGNAAVNMGGGTIVNNWALYQLDQTKSGTINAHAPREFLGVVDKDMYRLVDLQAGPNNGANSDSRYFDTWSGKDNGGFTILLTLIQAILMTIAIGGLGLAKIEASFMFSISILFLPFMLLYALLPQGRSKLQGYLANLVSLMLKRILITVMLAVLLKVITLSYASSDSLQTSALIGIFVSIGFIMYRKELLELMTANSIGKGIIGNDPEKFRETVVDNIPQSAKQLYSVTKANIRGATAGFVGGAMGAAEQKANIRMRRMGIAHQLRRLDKISEDELTDKQLEKREELKKQAEGIDYAMISQKGMSEEELEKLMQESDDNHKEILENELKSQQLIFEDEEKNREEIDRIRNRNEDLKERQEEIATLGAAGVRDSRSIMAQAIKGTAHSRGLIGRTAERRIRAEGLAPLTAYADVKEAVYTEGADRITNIEDEVEYDVYKEILAQSKNNSSKDSGKQLFGREQGELSDPEIQRKVRQLAKDRKKLVKSEDYKHATTPDSEKLKEAAEIVDRRRRLEKIKTGVTKPIAAIEDHQEDLARRKEGMDRIANTDAIKKEIEDHLEKDGTVFINNKGETIVRDRFIQKEEDSKEKVRKYQEHTENIEQEKIKLRENVEAQAEIEKRELEREIIELETVTRKNEEDKEDE